MRSKAVQRTLVPDETNQTPSLIMLVPEARVAPGSCHRVAVHSHVVRVVRPMRAASMFPHGIAQVPKLNAAHIRTGADRIVESKGLVQQKRRC